MPTRTSIMHGTCWSRRKLISKLIYANSCGATVPTVWNLRHEHPEFRERLRRMSCPADV